MPVPPHFSSPLGRPDGSQPSGLKSAAVPQASLCRAPGAFTRSGRCSCW